MLWSALAVGALSLAVRVAWVLHAHVTPIADFASYDAIAWRWLTTGNYGPSAYRTPGYPAFLAAIYALWGHSCRAAGLAQAALGGLTSALAVVLAARVVSPRTGLLAGMMHALSPTAVAYVPVLASENLALPLLLGALVCLVASGAGDSVRWRRVGLSGFLLGAHLLVRPAGVYFVPGFLLVAAVVHRGWRARAGAVAVSLCTLVLTLAPWLARNNLVGMGPATLATTGGANLLMGNNDLARSGGDCPEALRAVDVSGMNERERDLAYRSEAIAWIRAHPRRYLTLCGRRALRLLGTEADPWAAKYLTPSRESDLAMAALHAAYDSGSPASPELDALGRAVQKRNVILLVGWRIITAPPAALALLLALLQWRRYVPILGPALLYLIGLSLTFAKQRFRELSDPLIFIPLAALVADILFGTSELGARPSRRAKAALAVGLVLAAGAYKAFRYLG